MTKQAGAEVSQTILATSLTQRNNSDWHNLYCCAVQPLDNLMNPSSSQNSTMVINTDDKTTEKTRISLKICLNN